MIQPPSPSQPFTRRDVHFAQKETPGLFRVKYPVSVSDAPENLKVMVSQGNRTGRKGDQRNQGSSVPNWEPRRLECQREEGPCALSCSSILPLPSLVLENFRNDTSLPVLEGQSLRLLCVAHSNPPARLSWARGGQTLSPSQPSDPGVLELPQIQTEHEGEFTCRAQNPLGSQNISLSLSVVCECGDPCGQDTWVPGWGEAPLTLLPLYRPPAAAGTLLLPGG